MAIRKMSDLTTAARKGLMDFIEEEDGGTGKNAALSVGMAVGGMLMMQALATQVANANHKCAYAQDCPATDHCYRSSQGWAGCWRTRAGCNTPNFCPDP